MKCVYLYVSSQKQVLFTVYLLYILATSICKTLYVDVYPVYVYVYPVYIHVYSEYTIVLLDNYTVVSYCHNIWYTHSFIKLSVVAYFHTFFYPYSTVNLSLLLWQSYGN